MSFQERAPGGPTLASQRDVFRAMAPGLAADLGGVEALRAVIDPRLHDLLEGLEPKAASDFWSGRVEVNFGDRTTPIDLFTFRLRDEHGQHAGWVTISKPGISGVVLAYLATGDAQLFERMLRLLQPARRPTALLFADLASSSALSRRLSSRDYFTLIRRLASRADRSAVRAGGIVGKHVGDGITAFFLAETYGSESAAARACIEAARTMHRDAAEAGDAKPARRGAGISADRSALGLNGIHRSAADDWPNRDHRARRRGQRSGPNRGLRHRGTDASVQTTPRTARSQRRRRAGARRSARALRAARRAGECPGEGAERRARSRHHGAVIAGTRAGVNDSAFATSRHHFADRSKQRPGCET